MPYVYQGKPPKVERSPSGRPLYDSCQHKFPLPHGQTTYDGRRWDFCGAPTEGGKPTCAECAKLEAKGAGTRRRDFVLTYIA